MSKKNPTRREFLYGLGGAALYLPMMESLWMRRAFGRTTTGRTLRVVFICATNGQKQAVFYPNNNVPLTQFQPNINYSTLSSISGDISPVFGSAWNSIRNKV